jgi:hypothetical protein
VQGRLDRRVAREQARASPPARRAARVATGERPRGSAPRGDEGTQAATVAQARRTAADVRF